MKRVRFNEDENDNHSVTAYHHRVQHLNDMSKKESSRIWFTKDDYDRMKKNDDVVINFINNGTASNARVCTRGLEKKTSDAMRYKQCVRLDAVCAVLAEQERQRVEHKHDPERIAKLYAEATIESVKDALYWGTADAQAAVVNVEEDNEGKSVLLGTSTGWMMHPRPRGSPQPPTHRRRSNRADRMQRLLGFRSPAA